MTLLDGPARYSRIVRLVPGVSERMLSERLTELTAAGLVDREVETKAHRSSRYGLTEKAGEALRPARRNWNVGPRRLTLWPRGRLTAVRSSTRDDRGVAKTYDTIDEKVWPTGLVTSGLLRIDAPLDGEGTSTARRRGTGTSSPRSTAHGRRPRPRPGAASRPSPICGRTGWIVIRFRAFTVLPRIVRLHGKGTNRRRRKRLTS